MVYVSAALGPDQEADFRLLYLVEFEFSEVANVFDTFPEGTNRTSTKDSDLRMPRLGNSSLTSAKKKINKII